MVPALTAAARCAPRAEVASLFLAFMFLQLCSPAPAMFPTLVCSREECTGPQTDSSVFLHENVIRHENLNAFRWITPLRTCCFVLLCSSRKMPKMCHGSYRNAKGSWNDLQFWEAVAWGLRMMNVCTPSPLCRAQHVIFTFPPSSLWAQEKSVPGMKEAVLFPRALSCPSMPTGFPS